MTDAVGHAAQSQSMVEALTQSAKAGAQAHKTSAKTPRQADEADDTEDRRADHTAKEAGKSDDAAEPKSVEKPSKATKKSHHDGQKKDDKDKSFADTIDKLGTQSQSPPVTGNPAVAALPTGWTANLVFRQTPADHTQNDTPIGSTTV